MNDDAELLRRYVARNDQAAFGELVRRRIDLVYSVAVRQCGGDTHLAEDVTQRVFIDLARKARSLVGHAVLSGWLCQSARFAASDVVRAERRRRHREQEAMTMDDRFDSRCSVDLETLRPLLDEALSKLSSVDRDAIALRYFEQRGLSDVGAILRLSPEAARKRVDRALEKMREMLARRGIMSTSAALALALEEQGAIAAPTGLAAATIAAIPAAPAIAFHGLAIGAIAVLGVGIVGGWIWHAQSTATKAPAVHVSPTKPAAESRSLIESVMTKLPPAPPMAEEPEPVPATMPTPAPPPAAPTAPAPSVTITAPQPVSDQVVGVFGAVGNEGVIDWKQGMTLAQALHLAGDISRNVKSPEIQVTHVRKSGADTITLIKNYRGTTWRLQPRDIVYVLETPTAEETRQFAAGKWTTVQPPFRRLDLAPGTRTITVMGSVKQSAQIAWQEGMTLHDAIKAAGGLAHYGSATRIRITHKDTPYNARPGYVTLLEADRIVLAPDDIVYVSERIL